MIDELFELLPLIGAGKLRFGMTPKQIHEELGSPDYSAINNDHELTEDYCNISLGFLADENKLYHIGFGRQMNFVTYQGINLFQEDPNKVIAQLMLHDKTPYLDMGLLVFMKLGLTLTGFHDGDIDQKAVTLFDKRPWHDLVNEMQFYHK